MPASDQPVKVFEDRAMRGAWRVEKISPDGGYDDVQVFIGPDTREKAIRLQPNLRRVRSDPERPLNLLTPDTDTEAGALRAGGASTTSVSIS